ncbi:MAG TPA: hypothetical protein VK928_04745 [Longimicrobiales bacterium]|nr:hypothetical protein [Longimicrobiales bacterium]
MPDITLHDVPREELDALEARGRRHGRTGAEELRHMLHEAASEELIVEQLERATAAVQATRQTAERAEAVVAAPRRRYRTVEPTPRRRAPKA